MHGNGHAPFWNSGRRSDPPIDCNIGSWPGLYRAVDIEANLRCAVHGLMPIPDSPIVAEVLPVENPR